MLSRVVLVLRCTGSCCVVLACDILVLSDVVLMLSRVVSCWHVLLLVWFSRLDRKRSDTIKNEYEFLN